MESSGDDERPHSSPGDAFSRETLSHLPSARSFFEQYLPPDLARQFDWTTLRRQPESFLDGTLRPKFADLLFSARLDGQEALVYLLLENKTQPEYWTRFYLLELILRIWRKWLDNRHYVQGLLPPIVPLVLHQGPRGWHHSVRLADAVAWPGGDRASWARLVVHFEHLLVDLSSWPVEQIKGEARLRLALALMKAVRENRVAEVLPKIAPLFASLAPGGGTVAFLQVLARYLVETEEHLSASTIQAIALTLPSEESRIEVMKLADYLREEGREEGLQAGLETGLQKGRQEGILIGQILSCREILGLPGQPITELTRLSLEALQAMHTELKSAVARMLRP